MSSLDDAINEYFGKKEVIAEVINHFILKEEVNPSEMVPVDTMPVFHKLKYYGSKLTVEKLQNKYRNLFLMKTEKFYCALLVETEVNNSEPSKGDRTEIYLRERREIRLLFGTYGDESFWVIDTGSKCH